MSRIAINPERYQAFLDAFLTLGPRFSAVAKRVGSEPTTARKAWEKGWPEAAYAPPIRRVYEQALSRLEAGKKAAETAQAAALTRVDVESAAAVRDASQKVEISPPTDAPRLTAVEIAQKSAIEALQSEVDLLTTFRCNLIGAVTVSAKLLPAFEALAGAVAENVAVAAQNVAQVTPDRLLKPLEKFARIIGLLTTSTKQVIEMQRLIVGAPQQITEQRGTDSGDVSERMARAGRVLAQLQRSGLLPGTQAQIDAATYEGEESDSKGHSHLVEAAIAAGPDPVDSERSGNTLPASDEQPPKAA